MVQVICGNNVTRSKVIVDENNTTPRMVLENSGIDYSVGTTHLDGATLQIGEMDKTLAELGVTTKCYLLNVRKADNA